MNHMNQPGVKEEQQQKIRTQPGFIAALDQSGGSTPKALQSYGIKPNAWANDEEMFALVHQMRSVINQANQAGIRAVVNQQFEVAAQIIAAGLVPIVEPEVDIHCPEKAKAEALLKTAILEYLQKLPANQLVMLKLTLPEQDDLYADFVRHPRVLKVVALSGGYSLKEADDRLR